MIDRDDIIRMAREVADPNTADVVFDDLITLNFGEIERFAALVSAHEREQCACIAERAGYRSNGTPAYEHIAEAIRARSST